jgi:hypothetical protein
MVHFICLILLSLSVFASPREEAQSLLALIQTEENISLRMDQVSNSFLTLPYGDGGPLGEGENARYDQDPLYRFDTFDCTTFVETVVSLALSRNADEFEATMDKIRYENGEIDYLKRNHFPSLQWIPNNIHNGLLKEINQLILPLPQRKMAEAVIDLPGWLKKIKLEEIRVPLATMEERQGLLLELRSQAVNYAPIIARLDYLPISALLSQPQVLRKIPHGSIVNFVRPNWDLTESIGTHMNVSHQGLIFQRRNGTYLKHASNSGDKRVTEVPLLDYLKKFENHPTLKGIHLMQVLD